jgi:hypothetical protein
MPFQKGCKRAPTAGRKPGIPNKATGEIRAMAAVHGPDVIARLVWLSQNKKSPAVAVAACKELLDRGYGKAVQPHSGETEEGPVIVQVITGVPRAD